MTPELWQRLKPLFHAGLQEGPENRAAFNEAACHGDLELKTTSIGFWKPRSETRVRSTLHGLMSRISWTTISSTTISGATISGRRFPDDKKAHLQPNELIPDRFGIVRQ
jgi:hypothetical protein